jgi:cyclophilin family peptidyl-prolyl cis-trans isomerase
MSRFLACLTLVLAVAGASADGPESAPDTAAHPIVEFETSLGTFAVEVATDAAPASAANFLAYVDSGFYTGTVFHRVIPGFMIQGGGMDADLQRRETRPPIVNEADNGLANVRGTLAMARTQDPQSATAQFFVNVADNDFLDHRAPTVEGWGYAVFARVIGGMDTVDRIAATPTGVVGGMPDVPLTPVVIEKVRRRAP